MNYSFFVTLAQIAGLGLMGGCAVALLRLVLIHFVQRDWSPEQVRSMRLLTGLQAAGLLLFAFAGGGFLATRLFLTNAFPPLPAAGVQAALMAVLAAGIIFLHVVARPWLAEYESSNRPLVMDLSAHRILAMALSFAAVVAAWTLWLVQAADGSAAPSDMLASLALQMLVIWALLALPALVLRALALHALRPDGAEEMEPLRRQPLLPDVPQHRPVHIPAPRAPRPHLMMRRDDLSG